MNFSALGGITVLIVAALWILVYIPAWTHNAQRRDDARTQVRTARRIEREERLQRRTPRTEQRSLAERYHQLTVRVRFAAAFAFTGFAAVVAGLSLWSIEFAWMAAPLGLVVFVVAARSMRRANLERHSLASQSLSRRSARTNNVIGWSVGLAEVAEQASQPVQEAVVDARAWTPNQLPAPINMLHVGEIEQVKLAEVTRIQDSKQTVLEPENLDEILRRRRAIG